MAELWKSKILQNDAEFDRTFKPENLSNEELTKAYVALVQFSVIDRTKWLGRIEAEMRERGIALPH